MVLRRAPQPLLQRPLPYPGRDRRRRPGHRQRSRPQGGPSPSSSRPSRTPTSPSEPTPSPPWYPSTAPADPATPAAPIAYKSEFQKILTPAIPKIAAHLTDESQGDRILTAAILGGFSPDPPASIYPPLFAYLKRDDGVGTVGQAVVEDILQLGPIHDDAAAAIISYLHRPDQTSDSRSNLVEAIATHPFQSQSVNKVLLGYLDSDDPSLRARLILSLPQLDLAPDVFTETRERVTQLTANDQESLAVVNAAKSVATCWTAVKMASGCPVY